MNGESNGKPTEASPYMDPVNTTTIDHFKMIDRPGYYSSLDNDSNKLSEAMPYMDPIRTIINNHPKASGDDYETLPVLSMYEKPDCMTPYQYEVATDTAAFRNSMEDNTLGETLLDNEQIYEDPGHNKEKIYSWFEEKKFRKIGGSDIKYIYYIYILYIQVVSCYNICCLEFHRSLGQDNSEQFILAYGLMVLLILYK